jgi:hypothetical protein
MRTVILSFLLLTIQTTNAQNKSPGPSTTTTPVAEDEKYLKQKYTKHFADLILDMDLTEKTTRFIITLTGDTQYLKMRYSNTNMLSKLQGFIFTESANDSPYCYSPTELKGFSLFTKKDTLSFLSTDNDLNIICLFSTASFATFGAKNFYAKGLKKVFLNLRFDGYCRLFQFSSASNSVTAQSQPVGAPVPTGHGALLYSGTVTTIDDEDNPKPEEKQFDGRLNNYGNDRIRYCMKTGESRLVEITPLNIKEVFSNCAEAYEYANSQVLKQLSKMQTLISLYNNCKLKAKAEPQRY